MTSTASTSTAYSTYRTHFTSNLSTLVSTLHPSIPPPTPQELTREVERVIVQSGGWIKRDSLEEQDKWRADSRRLIVEKSLDEAVQRAAIFPSNEDQQYHLEAVLDLLLTFVELGYVDETVPLTTLAGLIELRPIAACEPLLGYIETRVERLTKNMEYQRGRGPILLRLLNDLLRRLPRSKPGPVILSGRILMLLSSVYPLGEKSGVNLRGNFNVGKGTVWEEEEGGQDGDKKKDSEGEGDANEEEGKVEKMEVEEGEEEEGEKAVDKDPASLPTFYPTFWSLQRYFNNPHLLFTSPNPSSSSSSNKNNTDSNPIALLHASLDSVLTVFSAETKKEKELTGSTTSTTTKIATTNFSPSTSSSSTTTTTTKGKEIAEGSREAVMIMGEKDELDKTEESLEQYFFPKFLTSRNLLSLELSDPTFRLQLILQTLILTQYLLSLTPSSRIRAQALPLTNATALPTYVLQNEYEKRIRSIEDKCWKEIENMAGGGKKVRRALESVLEREQNWTDWKLRSCQPFTRTPIPIETISQTVSNKMMKYTRPPPRFPHKLGNPRLSRVWNKDLKSLDGFEPDVADDEFDSIVREWRMTKKRSDMTRAQVRQLSSSSTAAALNPRLSELQASLEPMTIKLQALHFRALRSASTKYLRFFKAIGSGDLEKLLELIEEERRREEEKEEADELKKNSQGGGEEEGKGGGGEEEEEEKAAVRLGDTPPREEKVKKETIEEDQQGELEEAGTPPPPSTATATATKVEAEPGTPKRARVENDEDVEMKDGKKPKVE